ncbi:MULTISPECIES: hypothetical protein [unclassified Streptomyces]|uniref:hypothetical protein n=1 Tax=unclassified Streptomyces TaxID=2593676 RepID=UPI000DDA843F|nr:MULTISPECIES: hypothetical protein [unclassified Streptomyces]QZZ30626.1 hypothetical protein A7X85_34300 [Streptomyces sp. ST1015]
MSDLIGGLPDETVRQWGLIAETTSGTGDGKRWVASVLGEVEGTREQALWQLETRARAFSPTHPRMPRRTRLYRQDDAFLLLTDGQVETFLTRFSLAELIEDSAAE